MTSIVATKTCFKCKETKLAEFFKVKRGKITTCCRKCHRRYYGGRRSQQSRAMLPKKPLMSAEQKKENRRRQKKAKISERRDWLKKYLLANPCVDCGQSNIIVLQFDHLNPEQKKHEVPVLVAYARSLALIRAEIAKCDVVCANCHIVRTARKFGSWRLET